MKNKIKNSVIAAMLLLSQVSMSTVVLAETLESATKDSEQVEEREEQVETSETETITEESTTSEEQIPKGNENEEKQAHLSMNEEIENEQRNLDPTTRGTNISASSPDVWLPLGAKNDTMNAEYKKNGVVKIDNQQATTKSYLAAMNLSGNTDDMYNNPGLRRYTGSVTDKKNSNNMTHVEGYYRVNYGSSIVFESDSPEQNKKTGGIFTYNADSNGYDTQLEYKVAASNGVGNRNDTIHKDYANQDYYKIENFVDLQNMDEQQPIHSVTAKGNDTKGDVYRKWGRPTVYKNSFIRTWCADPDANNFYISDGNNTKVENYADKDGYAYYKVTETGFEPISTKSLKPVEQTITTKTSNEELDENIEKSFVEITDNAKILGFKEYPSREKVGKSIGKIEVEESSILTNNEPIIVEYEVPFDVVEVPLEVKLKKNKIPLGTKSELIKPDTFVDTIEYDGKKLDPSEYTVSFTESINTQIVTEQPVELKIELRGKGITTVETTTAEVVWQHSIATKSTNNKIDTSVSMLDNQGKPYLVANEGDGLSTNNLSTRPFIYVYRENTGTELVASGYESVSLPASKTMDKWNKELEGKDFKYGDVLGYKTHKHNQANVNEKGANTWVSRDEKLVRETENYDMAYYEMTKEGFQLLQLNQLEINPKLISVNQGTTLEVMNKQAAETMIIPKHIAKPQDFRFEFASVDTTSSGKKTTKMNVYEKLSTGGEFMTTYDVDYMVNSQITEKFFDNNGKEIQKEIKTDFDFNTTHQVKPNNYLTIDSELYIYQGWLSGDKNPSKDKPTTGMPPVVKESTTYQYIYKAADNMIDMTIPTELLFGTENNSQVISSKDYKIKNNSKEVSTEVILGEFKKEQSEVKLLQESEKDPTKQEKTARLNLMADQQPVIKGLTETTKDQSIKKLSPGESTDISLSGKYFGPLETGIHVKYQMGFKFKASH